MRKHVLRLSFIACHLACVNLLVGQVIINEYSASNLNSFMDEFGKTEDWIELYNASSSPVDISGYHLSDKESKPGKYEIPSNTVIPGNGFIVFYCSGRNLVKNQEHHTNFKLAQTTGKDILLLSDKNENIIEAFDLELTLVEHSRCRSSDGGVNWVVCTDPSPGRTNSGTAQHQGYTATPSMDVEAGFYTSQQTISITNHEDNAVLRYTTDGTNPTSNSAIYVDPIIVNETTVVKARAFSNDNGILPGKIEFNTYFINEDFSLVVFSVAADDVLGLAGGDGDLIPIGSLEYFNLEKEREATSFGSLNRHGQDSWVLPHRSLDWISRDEMGYSKAVDAELFSYSDRDEYQKFMFRNSGDDNYPAIDDLEHEGSTHVRDEYVQTLAMEGGMKLDLRAVERVILFLNGQYWGVYGMRERPVDHDYTDEYYDQGKYDIEYLTTWGTTEVEYGGKAALDNWTDFRDFILENDMSIEANYEIAEDSLNMLSLIDYMLVNLSVVASDWLNYNTGWWRGRHPEGDHKKWGYILWDLDATFDYYINYSGVPNISPTAEPCDLEDISDFVDDFWNEGDTTGLNPDSCATILNGSCPYPPTDTIVQVVFRTDQFCCFYDWDQSCQNLYDAIAAGGGGDGDQLVDIPGNVGKHEKIFLKLLTENPKFRQLYFSRYADMMNTTFSCDNMISTLDRMIDVIRPEMPRQIQRWGGTMTEWENNVQELREFILERCAFLDNGLINCHDELTQTHKITLITEPPLVGEIEFNTLEQEVLPWTGEYFDGMLHKIKGKVRKDYEEEYTFSHWESKGGNNIAPDINTRKATIELTAADTLIAHFESISAVDNIVQKYNLGVFPNPTRSTLTVELSIKQPRKVLIELYSSLGQQLLSLNNVNDHLDRGYHEINIPLHQLHLSTGIYHLAIYIDDEKWTEKVHVIGD